MDAEYFEQKKPRFLKPNEEEKPSPDDPYPNVPLRTESLAPMGAMESRGAQRKAGEDSQASIRRERENQHTGNLDGLSSRL